MTSAATPVTMVKRRAKALHDSLPAALEGEVTALHRARVASRRLRELLPLLELARSTPGKTRRRVRRLTQLLGCVREMDVSLALLEASGDDVPRLAVYAARQHVLGARDSRRAHMLRKLHKLSLKKLDRSLERLIAQAPTDVADWSRALATRIARRTARVRDAMASAGAIYVPERLHAVRLACKKLRYALEIAAESGVQEAAKLAAVVRRSQVTLGHLQDRHVLLREVHEAEAASMDEAVRQGLITLASQLEQAGRELHGQFLSQREALTAALTAVRQEIVPALISRSRAPMRASLEPGAPARRRAGVRNRGGAKAGTDSRAAGDR